MTGTAMRLWWQERSQREQGLIAMMLALLLFVLSWLLIARPLMTALDEAKLRHGQAVVALADAKARSTRWRGLPVSSAQIAPGAVEGLVAQTAAEAGFTGAQIVGQGPGRARVTIGSARAPAFFVWISALEGHGVTVEALNAVANPDRTVSTDTLLSARRR